MKLRVIHALLATLLFSCVTSPVISKSKMGNVEIQVIAPEGMDVRRAELFVDDLFVGNATDDLPVLTLRRGERTIRAEDRQNRWVVVASGASDVPVDVLPLRRDAQLLRSTLSAGKAITHTLEPGRRAYLATFGGSVVVNGQRMGPGDRAFVEGCGPFTVAANEQSAELVLVEIAV